MKAFVGLLVVGILGAAVAAQPVGPATSSSPAATDANAGFPGQADFERAVKFESERYERVKLRYEEATELARLNYIQVLENNLADLPGEDSRAAEYEAELTRVRSLKLHAPKFAFTTYWWEHNSPPVKMIHKDEGFCYLANVGGAFDGGAEVARVYIADDGYWYLHGSTGHGFLAVGAVAVKITR